MHRLLTAAESASLEERVVVETGISVAGLMREAGRALAREVAARAAHGEIIVLCGAGNNGGDGWVAAEELHGAGHSVRVFAVRAPDDLSGPAAQAASSAVSAGVAWGVVKGVLCVDDLRGAGVVVDALLGTGARLPLGEALATWCSAANESGAVIVSADIPTGVDANRGAVDPCAVRADCTVTFIAPKRGLILQPGASHAGHVVVEDLGVPREIRETVGVTEVWSADDYAALVPRPAADVHKNDRGRLLIIAGSGRYLGAAVLAARGAMRSGVGYVTLAVPEPVVATAQTHLLACPVVGLPSSRNKTLSSSALAAAVDLAHDFDAVVIGPGLTMADGAAATARGIVSRLDLPLVVDADALNALVDAVELIVARCAPTVLTPHPGELARLLGVSVDEVQGDRVSSSASLATDTCTVILKGAGTVVSGERRQVINTSGTYALATAGTGDVLAGMVGSLLAQGLSPFGAGAVAAYLHGKAGEAAAIELTPLCVTAEDVPEFLPTAFGDLLGY